MLIKYKFGHVKNIDTVDVVCSQKPNEPFEEIDKRIAGSKKMILFWRRPVRSL